MIDKTKISLNNVTPDKKPIIYFRKILVSGNTRNKNSEYPDYSHVTFVENFY